MKFLKFNNKEDYVGIIFFIIGIIFLLITSYIELSKLGVWADEIYSLAMIKMPLNDFISYSINDVHPILYYVFLKIFCKIFYFIDLTLTGKIFSLIPILLIGILSITKIKKNFGMLTAGIFFFCICSMPRILTSALEVRMYSWGLFFITTSLIFAYEITNNPNWKKWTILTVLTILSIYTHYFSAIASFSIYLVMLIYIIRKDKKLLKNWIISAIICIIAYIPWLPITYGQILNVNTTYWIAPISINTVISYIYYIFSPAYQAIRNNELASPTILGTLLFVSFIYLYYRNKDEFTTNTLLIFILVPSIGIIVSLISQPIFHIRYIIPVIGCMWLVFSIFLAKSFENLKVFIPITILILIIGILGIFACMPIHNQDVATTEIEHDYISNMGENNVIIINYANAYFPLFKYYAPNNHHFMYNPSDSNLNDFLNNPDIIYYKNTGSKIYYVDNIDMNETYAESGFNFTEIPTNEATIGYKIYEIIY
ncbi:MAG: glycosyltransferase family 39 protein [Methanobrevibacter sp.]|uniref:glycosyltransferase family 39 protein n=1 Tax=Methanobrevibacter sp. TaxID=66852 RepID=UPI0025E71BA9|nr:glycosyltransferase family 39 protein [Methanobrevibacter sp.]MBR0270561.1 glycosyltransferase family 39 protein [Methanobrevibacter sp.]